MVESIRELWVKQDPQLWKSAAHYRVVGDLEKCVTTVVVEKKKDYEKRKKYLITTIILSLSHSKYLPWLRPVSLITIKS